MIGDLLSTAARAQKLDIASIQRGIQDGVIPSYIGIPLLQQKMQERTEAAQMLAGKQAQNQPPIAQQVMSQAQQMTQPQAAPAMQQPQMQQPAEPGGIDQAQSNLPQTGFAGGGIVAFDAGGDVMQSMFDDEDPEDQDYVNAMMASMPEADEGEDEMMAYAPESMSSPTYNEMSYSRDSSAVKQPGQPEHGVAHEEISAKGKRGLEELLDLIKHKESRGRDYDTKGNPLTSPVGAKYAMQVMPATARDPGFGIKPAQSDSPDEYNRVGRELYSKLLNKYNDPKLAAIAYNMGPGKTDKWLSSGADMATLPQESRQYAQGFKEGGIAHFVVGGSTQDQIDADRRAMKTFGLNMLQPAAAAGDVLFGGPVNAVSSGISGIANAIGIPRAGRALGIYDPDVTSVGLPTVGSGSKTPYFDMLLQAKQNINEPKPTMDEYPAETRRLLANQASAEQERLAKIYQAQKSAGQTAMGNNVNLGSVTGSDLSAAYDPEAQATQAAAQPETTQSISAKDDQSGGLAALFNQQMADNKKERDINKYLALMSAGFGMMGGSSPYAFQNIGRGAQQGISTFAGLNQSVDASDKAILAAQVQNAIAQQKYGQLDKFHQQALEAQKERYAALDQRQRDMLNQQLGQKQNEFTEKEKARWAGIAEKAKNDIEGPYNKRIEMYQKDETMPPDQKSKIIQDLSDQMKRERNLHPLYRQGMINSLGIDPGAAYEADSGSKNKKISWSDISNNK